MHEINKLMTKNTIPKNSASHFDESFDVIVVGYGFAGAVAALTAYDEGVSVLLVEKMPDPGGISICSGGGLRLPHDRDKTLEYLKATNDGTTPDTVLEAFLDEMVHIDKYVHDLAEINCAKTRRVERPGNYTFPGYDKMYFLEIDSIPDFNPEQEYPYATSLGGGPLLFKILQDNIASRGIETRLGVSAKRMITNEFGEVAGVWLDAGSGPRAFGARRAVILACGGFEHAPEMQRQYWQINPVYTAAFVGNTGDGIRMATDLGANLWHMWHFHGTYAFRHPDLPFAIRTKRLPDWVPGVRETQAKMSWILLDGNGRRFMNEYDPYMQDTGHRALDNVNPSEMGKQSYVPCYLVLDDEGRTLYPLGKTMFNDGSYKNYKWSKDNLKEVKNGLLKRAKNIEELARFIGCPLSKLKNSIEIWNKACIDGKDDLGRPSKSMMPIQKPPFYMAQVWPCVSNTQGGPVHDEKRRVLNSYDEPIPKLYTAGELGSIWGSMYLSGGNLTECFVSGRIAGRAAAGEPLKKTRATQ